MDSVYQYGPTMVSVSLQHKFNMRCPYGYHDIRIMVKVSFQHMMSIGSI